jgi:hypothetical protein
MDIRWLCLLLAACGGDLDYDGAIEDDCDPRDPLIYPGAPDAPGDGIDADCDGRDADYPFFGEWELLDFEATVYSEEAINPGSSTGSMTIARDLTVTAELVASLSESLLGLAITLDLALDGTASPIPGTRDVNLYLKGEALGEKIRVDLRCAPDDENDLACAGGLKALDTNLDASAWYGAL